MFEIIGWREWSVTYFIANAKDIEFVKSGLKSGSAVLRVQTQRRKDSIIMYSFIDYLVYKWMRISLNKKLEVKTGGEDNVPFNEFNRFGELVFEVCISDHFRGLTHLAQQFFQSSHTSNDRTLESVSHFA